MQFERVEWDDANLDHATVRASVAEIEQAIANADRLYRNRQSPSRRLIRSDTDGGRRLVIVIALLDDGRAVRPITAWEE